MAGRLTGLGYRPVVLAFSGKEAGPVWSFHGFLQTGDVVVLNTASRDRGIRETALRAREASQSLLGNRARVVYLKIDSTLRGHWPEALQAAVRVVRPALVLICPAFPREGRVVRRGKLWVEKRLPDSASSVPGPSPRLLTILKERCGWEAQEVHLPAIRRGPRAILDALERVKGFDCAVLDAEREQDLAAIGAALRDFPQPLLWVGSAGLAPHVFPPRPHPPPRPSSCPAGPWVLISGSRQAVTHRQIDRLRGKRGVAILDFLPGGGGKMRRAQAEEVLRGLGAGQHVAVVTPAELDPRVPAALEQFLGELLGGERGRMRWAGIFVTGGTTAEAVCDSLGIRLLRVVGEVQPGVPLSVALDGRRPGLRLVTKAGGFGGPESAWRMLAGGFRIRA